MTFEEYLEYDKLVWKGKQTKRKEILLEKWQKLTREQQDEYINRKIDLEVEELKASKR